MKQPDTKTVNRVVLSSLIGATIEWYDFFLYGVMAGIVLNKLFFPADDPTTSLLLTYATFAVGFLTRPIGAPSPSDPAYCCHRCRMPAAR